MIDAGIGADAIRRVFERAPVLCERLVERAPYASRHYLLEQASLELTSMSEHEQIAVLDAHPRIGADPSELSPASRTEQGPDADPTLVAELAALNGDYERKFGFRFVVFVHGRSKGEIVPVLRERLVNDRDAELRAGLEEFLEISRDRLRTVA